MCIAAGLKGGRGGKSLRCCWNGEELGIGTQISVGRTESMDLRHGIILNMQEGSGFKGSLKPDWVE